jgi:hypothetical protein
MGERQQAGSRAPVDGRLSVCERDVRLLLLVGDLGRATARVGGGCAHMGTWLVGAPTTAP